MILVQIWCITLSNQLWKSRFSPTLRPKTNSFFTPLKEIIIQKSSFILTLKLDCFCIRNENFYCICKGFHEKLDCLTLVSLRSFFVKNNFVSLSLSQFADFVCKLRVGFHRLFYFRAVLTYFALYYIIEADRKSTRLNSSHA